MVPHQKGFPLIPRNAECIPFVPRKISGDQKLLVIISVNSEPFDSWDAWSQLPLMVYQYAGAPDSKMKNNAIWSKTVVEECLIFLYL